MFTKLKLFSLFNISIHSILYLFNIERKKMSKNIYLVLGKFGKAKCVLHLLLYTIH